MTDVSMFLKRNKTVRENVRYAPTKSLRDENGPLEFVLRPMTSKENEELQEQHMKEVPIPGRPGAYRSRMDVKGYLGGMLAASVVVPDLYNEELQDSYGVRTPEDLLKEMVDDPGEYTELTKFVQKMNGFDAAMDDRIDEAKN